MCICIYCENEGVNTRIADEIQKQIIDKVIFVESISEIFEVKDVIHILIVGQELNICENVLKGSTQQFWQEKIRSIIFLTQDESCLKQLFGHNVIGCVNVNHIKEDLDFIFKRHKKLLNNIEVNDFNVNEITYFKAEDKYVQGHTTEGESFLWRKRISELEENFLKLGFRRIHRSYLINVKYVEKIEADCVLVKGQSVPVSKGKRRNLFL